MKSSVALLLFGLVVFVATISARPNHGEPDLSNNEESDLDHNIAQSRHHSGRERRRHSRQISDRYERLRPSYYVTRAEFEIYKQTRDLIDLDSTKADVKIIKQLLIEYIDLLKKPYSPPVGPATGSYAPPIFVMLPPYPYSQIPPAVPHNSYNNTNNRPDINIRNGLESNVINNDDDENDEGRPISFKPVKTNSPQGRPLPPVEHGSVQAGLPTETTTTPKAIKTPGVCEATILLCCRHPTNKHKECFQNYGCTKTFDTGLACSPKAITMVIQRFKDAYAPR